MPGYSELKRIIPGAYKLSDFITDAKFASIEELIIQLQINPTGSGCRSGTNNILVLSDPKKRIKNHEAIKISVNGAGYTAKEYCDIARAAEKLMRDLKGFKVIYDKELTDVLKKCEEYRSAPNSII